MIAPNVLAYAAWHLRDSLLRALAPIGLWLSLSGVGLAVMIRGSGIESLRSGPMVPVALQAYIQGLSLALTLGALVLASGYVAQDRAKGHVRFLFSTPVVAWQFYCARFVIGLICFVAATTLIPVGFSLSIFPVPIAPVAASAAMYGLLLGSLSFLAGALTHRDGAVVIVVTVAAGLLQPLAARDQLPGWLAAVASALPPLHAADGVRTAWFNGASPGTGDFLLVIGYALAMLVVSLLIIRRAPLVR